MKKLKIKALFVNHVEKMVFGLFAIIVLVVLSKTTWGVYPKTPAELMDNVTKVKDSINAPENIWPDQAQFKIVDYSDKARQLFSPISIDRYYFSTPLFYPLNQVDEPRREPIFQAIQSLTAKATLVTLSVRIEPDPSTSKDATKIAAAEPAPAATDEENQFKVRGANTNTGAITGVNNNPTAANMPDLEIQLAPTRSNLFGGRRRDRDDQDDDFNMTTPPQSSTRISAGNTSRGVPVVAVRGVFPLKQQLKDYQQALHITQMEAARDFELRDFILERQTARQGADPWKDAEWKTVSIESAEEILLDASDIDREDPVPLSMKDPVITMDLPLRLIGFWGEFATHPRIKSELLKKEDLDRQNQVLDTLDKTATDSKVSGAPKQVKRGLAKIQPDLKGVANRIRNDKQLNERMNTNYNNYRKQNRPGMEMQLNLDLPEFGVSREMDRLLDDKNYILFRYLDFDVLPGFAYRYRVRLKVTNPNFEIPAELRGGADPNITQGEERETPWSNTSDAAEVPKTMEYFLENVLRDPYREEKYKSSEANPVIQLSMFDWDSKHGTYVTSSTLGVPNIGSFIGDEKSPEKKEPPKKVEKKDDNRFGVREKDEKKDPKKAEEKSKVVVLDLAAGGLVKKNHFFSTLDVLVDVEPDVEIDPDQHPDLKFPMTKEKGKSKARIALVEEALVSTSLGELKVLEAVNQSASDRAEKERLTERVNRERRDFKLIEDKDKDRQQAENFPRGGRRRGLRGFSRQQGGRNMDD